MRRACEMKHAWSHVTSPLYSLGFPDAPVREHRLVPAASHLVPHRHLVSFLYFVLVFLPNFYLVFEL